MRIIALDIGQARIGVAYANTKDNVACPVKVINPDEIKEIIYDYEPDLLVFGLPLSLDGNESEQTLSIKNKASEIANKFSLDYKFVDERLSSKEAKQILKEQGLSEKQMKGKIDMIAASLFLEKWLKNNG